MKLLTISVAAYNVERYIDKLMESVLDERILDHLEVLIVNDGSSDATATIADEYQKRYPDTVRHINKENGGHGSTINRGICEAKGKYFRALDGDDWVDTDALVRLIESLSNINSDIIINDYRICYEAGGEEYIGLDSLTVGEEYRFEDIVDKVDLLRYHAVVYRTDFLKEHNITIGEKCFYVDTEFLSFPVPYIQSVIYFKYPVYCYRVGVDEQSVSVKGKMKHIDDARRVAYNLLSFYQSLPTDITEQKMKYLHRVIATHSVFYINSLWLFAPTKEIKQKIIDFEKDVKKASDSVYNEMFKSAATIKLLRLSNYLFYAPLCYYKRAKFKA